jgi:glucose-1-phosphate thymidylyltransferase
MVNCQQEDRTDAAFLVKQVPMEASRYSACDTSEYGEVIQVMKKPENSPMNLVMTGFYTFSPAFHACHLIQPSDRRCELRDAIDFLIQSRWTVGIVRMDG